MRPRRQGRVRRPYDLVRADPEPGFEISVDGVPVPVVPGQTVGAAMHGAGIRSWRTTRIAGRPRGLFCGIGVCFDCLVTVNDSPSLRACVTEARPGDRVSTGGPQDAAGEAALRGTQASGDGADGSRDAAGEGDG
ncbi:(2Fe-2S)-binding protein [Streptosporangium carneum]|uniref:Proline dehydrogenase n=1 Tax=Streptosporangium carneum TaxID=47481 RepID=A0A9W6I0X0_9ACTN|nr:(2Fe-2S)-binding protein [Streptosporangium carneum]GLK09975.1 hypothetical protein GCM10017600_33810 [Streptosporangium carneum]